MRVTYLFDPPPDALDDLTALQADTLVARGHAVRIVAIDRPAAIRGGRRAEWIEVEHWREVDTSGDDVVIGTSPRTVGLAAANHARPMYLCQTPGEQAAGSTSIPMIVTGPALLQRWSQEDRTVLDAGLIVPDDVFRAATPRESEPLRVLLAGASQTEWRGIDDGYGAVGHARWFHQRLELVRSSPWAPSREEPLDSVQEFHVGLTEDESRRLLHSCDVVLIPAHAAAPVSLLAAEALAAGVACVMTATPENRSLGDPADYALFGPEQNAVELGERLIEVLTDEGLRTRLRARGREVAEQWRPERAAERLEMILSR